jgi:hypothetical protein
VRKAPFILATAGALLLTGIAMPQPAEAWRGRFGPGIAGGLVAGAIIGGLAASSVYAWDPGYAYYGPAYGPVYGPAYGPVYYGPPYYPRQCPGPGYGDYYNCGAYAVPGYGYNYGGW